MNYTSSKSYYAKCINIIIHVHTALSPFCQLGMSDYGNGEVVYCLLYIDVYLYDDWETKLSVAVDKQAKIQFMVRTVGSSTKNLHNVMWINKLNGSIQAHSAVYSSFLQYIHERLQKTCIFKLLFYNQSQTYWGKPPFQWCTATEVSSIELLENLRVLKLTEEQFIILEILTTTSTYEYGAAHLHSACLDSVVFRRLWQSRPR